MTGSPGPWPNPPARYAPTPTKAGGGRQALALLVALVAVIGHGAVLVIMQTTWGQTWWTWPPGWLTTPRLVAYGTALAAVVLYAILGRLLARGATYVVGLVLVILGVAGLTYVWFVVTMFTGLRL